MHILHVHDGLEHVVAPGLYVARRVVRPRSVHHHIEGRLGDGIFDHLVPVVYKGVYRVYKGV